MHTYVSRFLSACLAMCFILALISCGTSTHDESPKAIFSSANLQRAYEEKRALLVYAYSKNIVGSESYADWAEYLNEYKRSNLAKFVFIQMPDSEKVVAPSAGAEYSLFVKQGYPSFLYEGLIVEPMVYSAVEKIYTDKPLTDIDKAFMPEKIVLKGD